MKYKNLGRTGLKISAIGLGCGNFGGIGSAPAFFGMGESEPEAFAIMDAAWELGINFFDTADAYGGGRSETTIGHWLKTKGARVRDQLLLSSKVFNRIGDPSAPQTTLSGQVSPNDWGLSRRHILRQVETSLTRLGTDHLDMYLTHEPDPTTPLDETLRALDDVIRQGKVRYSGASNMPAWLLAKALWLSDKQQLHRFEWVQNSYSLLERGDEQELLPLCADQQLGYTPFSPLGGGWLTGKYRAGETFPTGSRMTLRPEPYQKFVNEQMFRRLDTLQQYAVERSTDMATLSLAWVMSHPLVTAPIIGPRKPEHLLPAARALELSLSNAERETIAKLLL